MEEKFDYLILTEFNEWVSTGKQETEKQLQDEIIRLKEENPLRELMVFKTSEFKMITY